MAIIQLMFWRDSNSSKIQEDQRGLIKKINELITYVEEGEAANKLLLRLRTTQDELNEQERILREVEEWKLRDNNKYQLLLKEIIAKINSKLTGYQDSRTLQIDEFTRMPRLSGTGIWDISVGSSYFTIRRRVEYHCGQINEQVPPRLKEQTYQDIIIELVGLGVLAQTHSEFDIKDLYK